MQTAPAMVAKSARSLQQRKPGLLPQTRHPGTLTPQSGLRVLFSVVSLTPDLVQVPDQMLAQAAEA